MKTKLYLYGSAISAVAACLCAAPARHYANSAYSLWLSRGSAGAHDASKANHLWAGITVAFAFVAAALLFAGLRSSQRLTPVEHPG
jgi:hypothetical protein